MTLRKAPLNNTRGGEFGRRKQKGDQLGWGGKLGVLSKEHEDAGDYVVSVVDPACLSFSR